MKGGKLVREKRYKQANKSYNKVKSTKKRLDAGCLRGPEVFITGNGRVQSWRKRACKKVSVSGGGNHNVSRGRAGFRAYRVTDSAYGSNSSSKAEVDGARG